MTKAIYHKERKIDEASFVKFLSLVSHTRKNALQRWKFLIYETSSKIMAENLFWLKTRDKKIDII